MRHHDTPHAFLPGTKRNTELSQDCGAQPLRSDARCGRCRLPLSMSSQAGTHAEAYDRQPMVDAVRIAACTMTSRQNTKPCAILGVLSLPDCDARN
jgi:hypothetical protein